MLLMPRLGSNEYELVIPTTWHEEPAHPFVGKFGSGDDKLSLNGIFEHGLWSSRRRMTTPACSCFDTIA